MNGHRLPTDVAQNRTRAKTQINHGGSLKSRISCLNIPRLGMHINFASFIFMRNFCSTLREKHIENDNDHGAKGHVLSWEKGSKRELDKISE